MSNALLGKTAREGKKRWQKERQKLKVKGSKALVSLENITTQNFFTATRGDVTLRRMVFMS
jgi:hypothetical protein